MRPPLLSRQMIRYDVGLPKPRQAMSCRNFCRKQNYLHRQTKRTRSLCLSTSVTTEVMPNIRVSTDGETVLEQLDVGEWTKDRGPRTRGLWSNAEDQSSGPPHGHDDPGDRNPRAESKTHPLATYRRYDAERTRRERHSSWNQEKASGPVSRKEPKN